MLRMSAGSKANLRLRAKVGIAFATCLAAMTGATSSAWAQCTDVFPGIALFKGGATPAPAVSALPLGAGSSIGALTATLNSINTAFLTTNSAFVTGGSGVWVRGVGGVTESKSSSVGTLSPGTNPLFTSADLAGSVNCKTTVRQEFSGFQIGVDLSNQVAGNGRWNWGIMGGRLQASTKDLTGEGTFSNFAGSGIIPASSYTGDTGIPFAGLYGTFTQGGFFSDAQVRYDFYQSSGSDPQNVQPFSFSGRGLAVTGNVGYNMPLAGGWFIEPSGGVVWSRTSFDTINVLGLAGSNIGGGPVSIDDVTSILGRASFRVGTNIPVGKITYQTYFTYSLFHEFNGDVSVKSVASNTLPFNGDGITLTSKSSGGVGTYSQFAFGTAAVLSNTTTAYVRGDYKIGENIEGWGVSLGMRVNF